ncbi:MAG: LPS assembly lipoprotein LptE [Oligoflexia bacterium]
MTYFKAVVNPRLVPASVGLFCMALCGVLISSCGYSIRTSRDPSKLKQLGVHRVYVRPVENQTFRPGVENAVYSQAVRMLSSMPGLRTVHSPELADAELATTVVRADRVVSGEVKASDLNPKNRGSGALLVASEYSAQLGCSFVLLKGKQTLWSGAFDRSRPFPANSQIGSMGSTGALINESEFERALTEVATDMMLDVRNSLAQDH